MYLSLCVMPDLTPNTAKVKDTGHAALLPAPLLLPLRDGHVQNVHSFLIQHTLLKEELHQGEHLCRTQNSEYLMAIKGTREITAKFPNIYKQTRKCNAKKKTEQGTNNVGETRLNLES